MKFDVRKELEYIDKNFEFSESCTRDRQKFILDGGLAYYYDGTLMLTNGGELAVGYTAEEIGLDNDDEEDITEAFYYTEEFGDRYE